MGEPEEDPDDGDSPTESTRRHTTATPRTETGSTAGSEFFVSPEGDDDADGSEGAPFASIEAARDRIRELHEDGQYPDDGVTVTLREGTYRRTSPNAFSDGEGPISLDRGDGGTPDAPVVYRGHPDESVRISGGLELPTEGFEPISGDTRSRIDEPVRDDVLQFDLAAHDIDGYGAVEKAGFGVPDPSPPPDLFVDDDPMRLARWPNDAWVRVSRVRDAGGVPSAGGDWEEGAVFEYSHRRPALWEDDEDVWMLGYWGHNWAHGNLQVESIDAESRVIETRGASVYGVRQDQPYYYYNILEEITEPGEYYIDRDSETLYLYPPDSLRESTVEIAVMRNPLIRVQNVSHLELSDVTIGTARSRVIEIRNCSDVVVDRCDVRNVAENGVRVQNCDRSGVRNSRLHTIGGTALTLHGGDRTELTPGRCFAENNEIQGFGRFERTYAPGVRLAGVGNVVRHNLLRNAPHAAILFSGNDHVIEKNEIAHVCREASDVGAIYSGRDWTRRGTVVRHNFFHHIDNDFMAGVGQVGVYFDDLLSGNRVEGNVFYAVDRGVLVGGGRHVELLNNLFVDCETSITFDQRGAPGEWYNFGCNENSTPMQRLEAVPFREPPWATEYPALADILEDDPCLPKHNEIRRNAVVGTPVSAPELAELVREHGIVENNFIRRSSQSEHGFRYDPETGAASLEDGHLTADEVDGWEPIQLDDIGLE